MKELIEIGGAAFLLPAVLAVLVLYGLRGLSGLQGRRSQHRREVLELWNDTRAADDLWLQVAVRQLFGAWLPAPVIRLAMAQPDAARALLELSEFWPLVRYDRDTRRAHWRHGRHATVARRRSGVAVMLAVYVVVATAAIWAATMAARWGATTLHGWVFGGAAVVAIFIALIALLHKDALAEAASSGQGWIDRINAAAPAADTRAGRRRDGPRARGRRGAPTHREDPRPRDAG